MLVGRGPSRRRSSAPKYAVNVVQLNQIPALAFDKSSGVETLFTTLILCTPVLLPCSLSLSHASPSPGLSVYSFRKDGLNRIFRSSGQEAASAAAGHEADASIHFYVDRARLAAETNRRTSALFLVQVTA